MTRRGFLGTTVGAAAFGGSARADSYCVETLETEPGPFFPLKKMNNATDLVGEGAGRARGEVLYVYGVVSDHECHPISGARVVIWQADAEGHYDHPEAEGHDDLDPNFKYFGEVETSTTGSYRFRTIMPKSYAAFGLDRAAHIHFRITAPGMKALTTEMYFAGQAHDARRKMDAVWASRPAPARNALIIKPMLAATVDDLGVAADAQALACRFDITLT